MDKPTPAAIKRLTREFQKLSNDIDDWVSAHWDTENDNILRWYFVFKGSDGTPYESGVYMGTLLMSPHYPFKPPRIEMITPSGRFTTNTRLCMSFSDYHPESWNPAWPIKSIILGIQSFMMDPTDPTTVGGIKSSKSKKIELAKKSIIFNASNEIYNRYFSDFNTVKNTRSLKKTKLSNV